MNEGRTVFIMPGIRSEVFERSIKVLFPLICQLAGSEDLLQKAALPLVLLQHPLQRGHGIHPLTPPMEWGTCSRPSNNHN